MANNSYIEIPETTVVAFERTLREAVAATLGERWEVTLFSSSLDEGVTYHVILPGTAVSDGRHHQMADGEDWGFPVVLSADQMLIVARSSPNPFERWASGRCTEELADRLGCGVTHDATNVILPPGTRLYRVGTTFQDYLSRNCKKPLSPENKAYIERYRDFAPKGHWTDD